MFALSSDVGGYKYPRLIRYVALQDNILATLDKRQNFLRIDPKKYELLKEEDKQSIIKTHETITNCYLDRSGVMRIYEKH